MTSTQAYGGTYDIGYHTIVALVNVANLVMDHRFKQVQHGTLLYVPIYVYNGLLQPHVSLKLDYLPRQRHIVTISAIVL